MDRILLRGRRTPKKSKSPSAGTEELGFGTCLAQTRVNPSGQHPCGWAGAFDGQRCRSLCAWLLTNGSPVENQSKERRWLRDHHDGAWANALNAVYAALHESEHGPSRTLRTSAQLGCFGGKPDVLRGV